MTLQNESINWSNAFKYLGITFKTGKKLKVDIDVIKSKCYASCNSILCKSRNIDELTRLSLIHANCLPILLYAIPALILTGQQVNELNMAWNSIYRNIF